MNGQKIFTTGGHDADYIWLACRTDPAAVRHRGISILIVDTSDPGFSWSPIITPDGAHHVNATLPDGDLFVVNGTKVAVPYAAAAYWMLVPTSAGVVLVDPQAEGVTLTRTPTSTGSPEYTVRLSDVRIPVSDRLDGDAAELYRCAVAGAGAVADGLLSGAMELTAKHVATREQFGKPLATFQAVAQQIADIYVTSRTLHVAALSAGWRLGAGLDAQQDLNVLGYWLAAELPAALQVCHHLHGGLGVDVTYPLHRYSSQALDLARLVGGAAYRLDLLGAQCSSS